MCAFCDLRGLDFREQHGWTAEQNPTPEQATERLARVRDLHRPIEQDGIQCNEDDCQACINGDGHRWTVCAHCAPPSDADVMVSGVYRYPCPTMSLIDSEAGQ